MMPGSAPVSGGGTSLGVISSIYPQMPYSAAQQMPPLGLLHGKLSVPASAGVGNLGLNGPMPGPTTPLPLHAQLAASRSEFPLPMQMQMMQQAGVFPNSSYNSNPSMQVPLASYYPPLHQYSQSRAGDLYANKADSTAPEAAEVSYRVPSRGTDNAHSRPGQPEKSQAFFMPPFQCQSRDQCDTQHRSGLRAARLPLPLRSLTPMPVLHTSGAPNLKRPSSAGVPREQEDERDGEGLHEKGRCSPVDEVADPDADSDDEFSPARRLQSFTNLRDASARAGGEAAAQRSLNNLREGPISVHEPVGQRYSSNRGNLRETSLTNIKDDSGKAPNNNGRQSTEREVDASTVKRFVAQQKHIGSTVV